MPIELEELERNEATAPLVIGDQTGTVTYRPYEVTPDLERRVIERSKEIGQQSALAEMLAGLIVDWDVERGGEVIPVDYESLCSVPTVILSAAFGAVVAHMAPGASEGKASGGASSNRQTTRTHTRRGTRGS